MITTKGTVSNKKLRIYRPDVTLPVICKTNGANIVRTMIPCFPPKPDGSLYKFSYVYGVNVRTARKDDILPFSTAYRYRKVDEKTEEGDVLDSLNLGEVGITVPSFSDKYAIRELLLYAKVNRNKTISSKDVIILNLATDRELTLDEFQQLKKDLANTKSFFTKNVNALEIKERAYLWLTSEDYNVNTGGAALSNIIAIASDYDAIAEYIIPHHLDFINLLFLIKARYLFDAETEQLKTAIASAKAAIMSRNMSHNLGSHVMAYLKQHLNSVQDMIHDNVLSSLFTSEDDITTAKGLENWCNRCKEIIETQQEGLSEVALPFLVGLGKFISYLQERQDFIATIATDYIPYYSSVNFKDFIYDELNPDLRYERHKDRIGLQPDNILLGNIARSEGLARKTNPTKDKENQLSDIVIKYRQFDGKPVYDEKGKPKKESEVPNVKKKIEDLEDMRGFMTHLPGGVVGRQAIFSIVENIIRNAAKHGKWGNSDNKNLELTFDRFYLEDIENGSIQKDYVPAGDDTFDVFLYKYYAGASDIKDLCIVTLTDNMSFEQRGTSLKECINLNAIRTSLIEPYVDKKTVQMLQTNKGIKEMRISAAWMRGTDDDVKINPLYIKNDFDPEKSSDKEDFWIQMSPDNDADANTNSPQEQEKFVYSYWNEQRTQWVGKAPILMVRACANSPEEDYHLQYVFCLPKPKDVAVIVSPQKWAEWGKRGDPQGGHRKLICEHLSRLSWSIYPVDEYLNTPNKSFEFIIIDRGVQKDAIDAIRMVSPNRVFNQEDITDIINITRALVKGDVNALNASFIKKVKVALFEKLCNFEKDKDKITISDPKTKARLPKLKDLPKGVTIVDGRTRAKYLYRTHNETENLFNDFMDKTKNYKQSIFVEGITGNNSTDRLVRNDNIDDLWLYRHLHAMKTSVGIFDERIFSKIYKKDESDIVIRPLNDLIDECYESDPREEILLAQSYEELEKVSGKVFTQVYGDYLAIAYEKKGVGVFNIVKTNDGLDIYGYGGYVRVPESISAKLKDKENESKVMKSVKYYSIIEKVGEIRQIDGKIKITRIKNTKLFDYLTIHQGLLDKVYEQFGIRHNAYEKHLFTKSFYEAFCKDSRTIQYSDDKIKVNGISRSVFFLPRLRIHSGRSKPSFADMPQHQPFMQYAAIEHAIMDCKYSLVELLDFARYEK